MRLFFCARSWARQRRPGSASLRTRMCCGTPVASPWPTRATIRGPCKPTSATATSSTPSVTQSWPRIGLNAVTDHQIILKEKRTERQSKIRKARQETPPVAYLKYRETPRVAEQETPPVANIHLSRYTLSRTPSKKPSIQRKLLIESNQIVAMRKTASRRCIRGVLMRPWGQGSERPQGRVKLPAHNPGGKATEAPIAGRGEASVTRNQ